MAHELASTPQQAGRIGQRHPLKEPNLYVRGEGIDLTEGRISETRDGTAVMQKFTNFISTSPHHVKPGTGDG
jgi:hypothetical protein